MTESGANKTRLMDRQLGALLLRLRRSDRTAMSKIVALTAPHLSAIVTHWISNPDNIERVVRALYVDLWKYRDHPLFETDAPLDVLRAFARHSAIASDSDIQTANAFFEANASATLDDIQLGERAPYRSDFMRRTLAKGDGQ